MPFIIPQAVWSDLYYPKTSAFRQIIELELAPAEPLSQIIAFSNVIMM